MATPPRSPAPEAARARAAAPYTTMVHPRLMVQHSDPGFEPDVTAVYPLPREANNPHSRDRVKDSAERFIRAFRPEDVSNSKVGFCRVWLTRRQGFRVEDARTWDMRTTKEPCQRLAKIDASLVDEEKTYKELLFEGRLYFRFLAYCDSVPDANALEGEVIKILRDDLRPWKFSPASGGNQGASAGHSGLIYVAVALAPPPQPDGLVDDDAGCLEELMEALSVEDLSPDIIRQTLEQFVGRVL